MVASRQLLLLLLWLSSVCRVFEIKPHTQPPNLTNPLLGGKTVVLKTLGLVALMARAGIPIPAEPGARVDLFDPVLADIGDLQSVTGDLSTFSGHLVVRNTILVDGFWLFRCR